MGGRHTFAYEAMNHTVPNSEPDHEEPNQGLAHPLVMCRQKREQSMTKVACLFLCMKCMKLMAKYFFLADILLLEGYLRFVYVHFSLGIHVLSAGCLRLELSCIRVKKR